MKALFIFSAATGFILGIPALDAGARDGPPGEKPPKNVTYEARDLDGFRVMISSRLITSGQEKEALKTLNERLKAAVKVLPTGYANPIRGVPIWVDAEEPASIRGMWAGVELGLYVRIGSLDEMTGLADIKAGGIQLYADPMLLEPGASWARDLAPCVLLHEFAHALHDRILGFDDPDVGEAYKQALDRRIYDKVERHEYHDDGSRMTRFTKAYARTNHMEYFAALSEAFLGENKVVFPFKRSDIKGADPVGYSLMESFWRNKQYTVVNGFGTPGKVIGTGRNEKWRSHLFELAPGETKTFTAWPRLRLIVDIANDPAEHLRFPKVRGHEVNGVDSEQGVHRCPVRVRPTPPSSSSGP